MEIKIVKDNKKLKVYKSNLKNWIITKQINLYKKMEFNDSKFKFATIKIKFWSPIEMDNIKDEIFETEGKIAEETVDYLLNDIVSMTKNKNNK